MFAIEHRVFLFMLMAVKRNACGRRGLGRYPILRLTSSLLRCAAARWVEKVSECTGHGLAKVQARARAQAASCGLLAGCSLVL